MKSLMKMLIGKKSKVNYSDFGIKQKSPLRMKPFYLLFT